MDYADEIAHIRQALRLAGDILLRWRDDHSVELKSDGQPVTEADLEADQALREFLPRPGDGWLSEETDDDRSRLGCERVWIVDPLDGTQEFVRGIPEWSVSIGLAEGGRAVAGGVFNPVSDELVVGAVGAGVWLGDERLEFMPRASLDGASVVASRTEVRNGHWARFDTEPFTVVPTGSVAYKLALVACGRADATWTLQPKSEWDVAAGVALIHAGGGSCFHPDGSPPAFNREHTRLPGLVAGRSGLDAALRTLLLS